MLAVLDTNCFIDAVNSESDAHDAMQQILAAARQGEVRLGISRHNLAELSRSDKARTVAEECQVLPHWPIGCWDDQVATWHQLEGTWADAKRNECMQKKLRKLAKSGNDIRDRGGYVDAVLGGADVFVTSDRHLASTGAAERIANEFGLCVRTPQDFAAELCT